MNGNEFPSFSDPPLKEVAISVQFEPLQRLVVPEIGLLFQQYGDKYPHVEHHHPIEPKIERLGVRRPIAPVPTLKIIERPPVPRVWFLSNDKRELIQIQQDRFVRNWRKIDKDDEYPRYGHHVRPQFISDFKDFTDFVSKNSIGNVVPIQCEVTYVNEIVSGECWETHADIGKVFTTWSRKYTDRSRYEIEEADFSVRYLIRSDDGEFLGRLHISARPIFITGGEKPAFVLDLIARGRPDGHELDGVTRFIDLGHQHIVHAFAEVTRPELHSIWGRNDTATT